MEIKKNLKSLDIKISKLATDLGISRPTLDSYIDFYEKGITIPNDVYQKIFEYLFSSDNMTSIEFAQKYDYVKRVMLQDAKIAANYDKTIERELDVSNNIINSINSNVVNKQLLEFINLFIKNSEVALVKNIYHYFNYSNGFEKIEINSINDLDRALFSQMCKLFSEYQEGTIKHEEEYFQKLLDKNMKLFNKKKIESDDDEIIDYIKKNISDSNNIDFDLLKKMINSRKED